MTHTKRITEGMGKTPKFTTSIAPGAYAHDDSIALLNVLRDILGLAENAKEVRAILNKEKILVDKKAVRNSKIGVGLMNVIDLPEKEESYRVLPGKKGLVLKEIEGKETDLKPCKIMDKKVQKGGKIQLNLHDGNNILVSEKEGKEYETKDTIILKLPDKEIQSTVPLAEGSLGLVTDGRHAGETEQIKEVLEGSRGSESLTTLGELQTLTRYVMAVGKKGKAAVSI